MKFFSFGKSAVEKDLEKFTTLMKEKKNVEALPIIQSIVNLDPKISTSWFNLGACLSSLHKRSEAGDAYRKAFFLETDDATASRTLYRCCDAYASAKDENKLFALMEEVLAKDAIFLNVLMQSEELFAYTKKSRFQKLFQKYDSTFNR